MKIRLTTNTYQNFSHLKALDASYGLSYFSLKKEVAHDNPSLNSYRRHRYDYNNEHSGMEKRYQVVTPDNSFEAKLLGAINRVFRIDSNAQENRFNQTIAQAIDWLNQNMNEEVTDGVKIQINSSNSLNTFLQKALTYVKREYLGQNLFDAKETFVVPTAKLIVIGTNQDSRPLGKLAQRLDENRFILFNLLHEFGHHFEFTQKAEHFPPALKAFYRRVLSLNNDSLKDFDEKNSPQNLSSEEQRAFYQNFVIPDKQFIESLAQIVPETYADTIAILIERNMQLTQAQNQNKDQKQTVTWTPDSTIEFIEAIKQFRMDEMADEKSRQNSDDVIDMMVYSMGFGHLSYGGLDSLAERLKDYEGKILDEKTMHKIAEQCASQNLARCIFALDRTGLMRPRQIACLAATDFHWFDDSLVFTGNMSAELKTLGDEIQAHAGYAWCEQFKEKQTQINTLLTDQNDYALRESLLVSMMTDFKDADEIIAQRQALAREQHQQMADNGKVQVHHHIASLREQAQQNSEDLNGAQKNKPVI